MASNIKDLGTIKQYVARFRDLKEVNIHIFNNYQEECKIYDIEWLVNENISKASILKDAYNVACNGNTEFSTLGLNINPINLDTNVYFNRDINNYEIDSVYIRSQVYSKYYNSRTLESFKVLLEEYFENIEIVYNIKADEDIKRDKDIYKHELKLSKEEAIDNLEKYKDILIGYDEIKKSKLSSNLKEYLKINSLYVEDIQKEYLKNNVHKLINENSLKSMISLYSKYVLENSFSLDLAWNMAQRKNNKKIFAKINTIIYDELKQEYPNAFKNDYSLEVRVYELITHYLYEGVSYTQEHLEDLSEALRIGFGDNWSLSTKKISAVLNQIYNIDRVKINLSVADKNYNFYKNILPASATTKKRIDAYTIKSRIEFSDIKKELGATSSDMSLENSIQKRKTKILSQLDSNHKEILLEGIF